MSPDSEHPARLRVGVVGAGRVGTALAAALGRAGHQIVAVSAVSDTSVRRARRDLPGVAIRPPPEVVAAADLVLLTVPDDVLPGLVAGLAATGAALEGRLVAHTSGRHGLAVLDPAVRAGALPLALHPVMTFTGRPDDIDKLAGISFGVTAPDSLRLVAEALVVEMGGEPVFIAEEQPGPLPRRARERGQPPGHPGRAGRPTCCGRRAWRSRPGCSARCCTPRSTTRCGSATTP